mgnify:CR=1 FL=1
MRRPASWAENEMNEIKAVDATFEVTHAVGPNTVYSAGGLFTQDEMVANISIKEAVWRLSKGDFRSSCPSLENCENRIGLM